MYGPPTEDITNVSPYSYGMCKKSVGDYISRGPNLTYEQQIRSTDYEEMDHRCVVDRTVSRPN
jgi:hypothetical protein